MAKKYYKIPFSLCTKLNLNYGLCHELIFMIPAYQIYEVRKYKFALTFNQVIIELKGKNKSKRTTKIKYIYFIYYLNRKNFSQNCSMLPIE